MCVFYSGCGKLAQLVFVWQPLQIFYIQEGGLSCCRVAQQFCGTLVQQSRDAVATGHVPAQELDIGHIIGYQRKAICMRVHVFLKCCNNMSCGLGPIGEPVKRWPL